MQTQRKEETITADNLKRELIERELARRSLRDFTTRTYPGYLNAKHQDLLNEKLQAVERYIKSDGADGIGRLLVTMPPRHGKSEKVSVRFPGWFLGRNPDKRVIIASYGAELAEEWSQKVRNLMESDEYRALFGDKSILDKPILIDKESRKVQAWNLKNYQGGLVAAGVGGSITGRGAHLFVIDDAIKDREEADSETIRRKIKDWYTSVARTRLMKGGAIVVMMTRWHEDDLIGWLLETQKEKWTLLNLPAIAEDTDLFRKPGEALWPQMFDLKALQEIKEDIGRRDWTSLYQQQPTEDDGDVFQKDWFVYGKMPNKEDISKAFQVWDTAFTEKREGDYSACCTFFVTRDGLFLADVYRAHLGLPQLKEMMKMKWSQWNDYFRISRIFVENKGSGLSVMQSLKKETHLPLIALEPDSFLGKDKRARAEAASGYLQAGRVVFKTGAPWLSDFENELLRFPRGRNDDMMDAFVYGVLQQQGGGKPPRKGLREYKESLLDRMGKMDRHSQLVGGWMS